MTDSMEIIPTDYALAYATLARRVAAARAHIAHADYDNAELELFEAGRCIEQVEATHFIIKKAP